eukprot:TRINITY_DN5590_c0_g1_i1.p1 TRINITY_DN5590_c0_g1~~TRINITY_DN5590_c0_g1_i1.p1  ORF type:complete len:189 (-),score=47.46 TRINITY_DN5590_c0_g1_i1:26-592(-)
MDGTPLIFAVLETPVTFAVCSVCVGVWAYIVYRNIGFDVVGISYESVVLHGDYWRVFTASLSHASALHLAFNVTSLWSLRFIEKSLGIVGYLRLSFFLLVASCCVVLVCYHLLIFKMGREDYRTTLAVGYSCVVFGVMTVVHQRLGMGGQVPFFGLRLPISLMPIASLVITSIIVPQASFIVRPTSPA